MRTRCFETPSSPGCTCTRRSKSLTHSLHEGIEPYKCLKCDASFLKSQGLKIHITAVHEDKKPNKCNVCDKYFNTKYQMNGHIAAVHEGIKPYKCLQCDASFSYSHSLKKHITSVHEGKELKFDEKRKEI